MQHIAVVIEPAEEGGFIARVPALPGCVTEGDTRDAVRGYLASLKKHGEPWPPVISNPVTFVDVDEATI